MWLCITVSLACLAMSCHGSDEPFFNSRNGVVPPTPDAGPAPIQPHVRPILPPGADIAHNQPQINPNPVPRQPEQADNAPPHHQLPPQQPIHPQPVNVQHFADWNLLAPQPWAPMPNPNVGLPHFPAIDFFLNNGRFHVQHNINDFAFQHPLGVYGQQLGNMMMPQNFPIGAFHGHNVHDAFQGNVQPAPPNQQPIIRPPQNDDRQEEQVQPDNQNQNNRRIPVGRQRLLSDINLQVSISTIQVDGVKNEAVLSWRCESGQEIMNMLFDGDEVSEYSLKDDIFESAKDHNYRLGRVKFVLHSSVLLYDLLSEAVVWFQGGRSDDNYKYDLLNDPTLTCLNAAIMTAYLEKLCELRDADLLAVPKLHTPQLSHLAWKTSADQSERRVREAIGFLAVNAILKVHNTVNRQYTYLLLCERLSLALEKAMKTFPDHYRDQKPIKDLLADFSRSLCEAEAGIWLTAASGLSYGHRLLPAACEVAHKIIAEQGELTNLSLAHPLTCVPTAISCGAMLLSNYRKIVGGKKKKTKLTRSDFDFDVPGRSKKKLSAASKVVRGLIKNQPITIQSLPENLAIRLMEIVVKLRKNSDRSESASRFRLTPKCDDKHETYVTSPRKTKSAKKYSDSDDDNDVAMDGDGKDADDESEEDEAESDDDNKIASDEDSDDAEKSQGKKKKGSLGKKQSKSKKKHNDSGEEVEDDEERKRSKTSKNSKLSTNFSKPKSGRKRQRSSSASDGDKESSSVDKPRKKQKTNKKSPIVIDLISSDDEKEIVEGRPQNSSSTTTTTTTQSGQNDGTKHCDFQIPAHMKSKLLTKIMITRLQLGADPSVGLPLLSDVAIIYYAALLLDALKMETPSVPSFSEATDCSVIDEKTVILSLEGALGIFEKIPLEELLQITLDRLGKNAKD